MRLKNGQRKLVFTFAVDMGFFYIIGNSYDIKSSPGRKML